MSLPLAGKAAIVTGSSRSIGAAIAVRLASQGANVVINYVASASAAQSVADEINAKGAGRAIVVKADVGVLAEGQKLVDEAVKEFGRVDFLVLNAGVMKLDLLANVTEADYDHHFNTNVKGPLFLVQHAAPHMQPGSRVIFFSTSITRVSSIMPTYLLYAATKGAVEQMTRALSKELGAKGINVNTISPGPTDTDLFRDGKSHEQIKFFENMHPAKRLGQPDEVAKAVSFLCGDESSWVNGQTIMINGGFCV